MIKGSIDLYEEPKVVTHYPRTYHDWYDEWEAYDPKLDEERIDNKVAKAMADGFYIGKKVKRKNGFMGEQTGIIKHYVKKGVYKTWTNKLDILRVEWNTGTRFRYEVNYDPDDLVLVNETQGVL